MSETRFENVFFAAVARAGTRPVILASQSYNKCEAEITAVRQFLEQPIKYALGKHYSYTMQSFTWHVITDELGLTYILVSASAYPQKCALMALEELQIQFTAQHGDKLSNAKDYAFNKPFGKYLTRLLVKYDNPTEIDKLARISKKVDNVKLIMQENVNAALQNCIKLDSLEIASEELQRQAGVFGRTSGELRRKMWWRNLNIKIFVIIAVLVVLALIIGVGVGINQK